MKTKYKVLTAITAATCIALSAAAFAACTPDESKKPVDPVDNTPAITEMTYSQLAAYEHSDMTAIVWQGASQNGPIVSNVDDSLKAELLVTCYGESASSNEGFAVIYQAGLWNDAGKTYWVDETNHIAAAYYGTWVYEYNDAFSCNTLKLCLLGSTAAADTVIGDNFRGDVSKAMYEVEFNDIVSENPVGKLYSYNFGNIRKYLPFAGKGAESGRLGYEVGQGPQTNPDGSEKTDEEGNTIMGDVATNVTEATLQMEKKTTYATVAAWAATFTIA